MDTQKTDAIQAQRSGTTQYDQHCRDREVYLNSRVKSAARSAPRFRHLGGLLAALISSGLVIGAAALVFLVSHLAKAAIPEGNAVLDNSANGNHQAGPSQGAMEPQQDSILTRSYITPDRLVNWLDEELAGLGSFEPLVGTDIDYQYLASSTDINQSPALQVQFDECRQVFSLSDGKELPTTCERVELSINVDDCGSFDGFDYRSLEATLGPVPLGFSANALDRQACEIALELPMVAEGPLMLVENVEWMLDVVKNDRTGKSTIIRGGGTHLNNLGFRAKSGSEDRLVEFSGRADLELVGFPKQSGFITSDHSDLFGYFADEIGYIMPASDWQYEPYILLSETGLIRTTFLTDCGTQARLNCDGMEFYRWEYFGEDAPMPSFLASPGTHVELPDHDDYGAGGWITLNVNVPKRGISPPLLKQVLKDFDGEITAVQAGQNPEEQAVHESYLAVTDEMISEGHFDCTVGTDSQGYQLPEAAFYRGKDGAWDFVSHDCGLYFNEGYSDQQIVDFFSEYLARVENIFSGESWDELEWFVIASQPETSIAGQYYWAYHDDGENFAPGIVLNIGFEPMDLYSPQFIDTLVHEYAHHLHATDMYAVEGDKYSGHHRCVEHASPFSCKNFDNPFAEFLRAFWWEDSDGFSNHGDFNGYYRLIDSPEDFVSYYASYDAYEDFAESFTAAVLKDYYDDIRYGSGRAKVDFFLADGSPYKAHVEEVRSRLLAEFEISDPSYLTTDLHDVGFVRKLMNLFQ